MVRPEESTTGDATTNDVTSQRDLNSERRRVLVSTTSTREAGVPIHIRDARGVYGTGSTSSPHHGAHNAGHERGDSDVGSTSSHQGGTDSVLIQNMISPEELTNMFLSYGSRELLAPWSDNHPYGSANASPVVSAGQGIPPLDTDSMVAASQGRTDVENQQSENPYELNRQYTDQLNQQADHLQVVAQHRNNNCGTSEVHSQQVEQQTYWHVAASVADSQRAVGQQTYRHVAASVADSQWAVGQQWNDLVVRCAICDGAARGQEDVIRDCGHYYNLRCNSVCSHLHCTICSKSAANLQSYTPPLVPAANLPVYAPPAIPAAILQVYAPPAISAENWNYIIFPLEYILYWGPWCNICKGATRGHNYVRRDCGHYYNSRCHSICSIPFYCSLCSTETTTVFQYNLGTVRQAVDQQRINNTASLSDFHVYDPPPPIPAEDMNDPGAKCIFCYRAVWGQDYQRRVCGHFFHSHCTQTYNIGFYCSLCNTQTPTFQFNWDKFQLEVARRQTPRGG